MQFYSNLKKEKKIIEKIFEKIFERGLTLVLFTKLMLASA